MTRVFIQDKASFRTTARTFDDVGFLHVPGRVAKTGTQTYLRKELGLDGNPSDVVVVYRPEEEVFSEGSLNSFAGADITVLHPSEMVNAKNYKSTSVGHIKGAATRDGDYVLANLVIKDADAIAKVEVDGYVELSSGYTTEYEYSPGVTSDGVNYDYIQRKIHINHVALLPSGAARAGRQARIFDNNPKGNSMTKITLDSGRSVEIQDEASAALVSDYIERLQKQIKDSSDELEKKQAEIDAKEEELDKVKKETADAVISERVAAILDVRTKAAKIAPNATLDSLSPTELQRIALSDARPSIDWSTKSEAYVQAAFDLAAEQAETVDENAAQMQALAQDGAKSVASKKQAYDSYVSSFTKQNKE